jgi:hypothetical protein
MLQTLPQHASRDRETRAQPDFLRKCLEAVQIQRVCNGCAKGTTLSLIRCFTSALLWIEVTNTCLLKGPFACCFTRLCQQNDVLMFRDHQDRTSILISVRQKSGIEFFLFPSTKKVHLIMNLLLYLMHSKTTNYDSTNLKYLAMSNIERQ